MSGNKLKNGSGFTLIDLLVVIAIIALLMGVLMPALSRAKDAARAIQCGSNFKQIGVANYLYSQDFNHHIVPATFARPGNDQYWYNVLRTYMGQNEEYSGNVVQVFICPSDKTQGGLKSKGAKPNGIPDQPQFQWQLRSYGINGQTQSRDSANNVIGKKASTIRGSSGLCLATETQSGWYLNSNFCYPHPWLPASMRVKWWLDALPGSPTQAVENTPVETVKWHRDNINMVFVDGHVERFETASLYPGETNERVWHESGDKPFVNF